MIIIVYLVITRNYYKLLINTNKIKKNKNRNKKSIIGRWGNKEVKVKYYIWREKNLQKPTENIKLGGNNI